VKIRTLILITLLLFALAPVVLLLAFGLPPVLERLQGFYQQAHLQQLRADFKDLDQHLASRQALTGVLAKLPEPGTAMASDAGDKAMIDDTRAKYAEWINNLLDKQYDIVRITFADTAGNAHFWLERETPTSLLTPSVKAPALPAQAFLTAVLNAMPTSVLVSPLYTEQGRFLRLHLASTVRNQSGDAVAIVIMTIDPGGLANVYPDTLWVTHEGTYLYNGPASGTSSFGDFQGLEALFKERKIGLWKGKGSERMLWVPMFQVESGEPLWVGRKVDVSPLSNLWKNLAFISALIGLIVLVLIWLIARKVANKLDRISHELGDGVQQIIEEDEAISFSWKGPEELRTLAENLSRLAATHARNSRNLKNHTRELEASNRFKTQFLANVSHELKTPLNSILVLSKLLKQDPSLDKEAIEKADVIHKAGTDLHGLIDNILELSRVETLDNHITAQTVDVRQLLEDIQMLLKPQFDEKGLSLSLQYDRGVPTEIMSDPDKIRQIIKNLLSNALKFTRSGGVTIRVKNVITAEHRGQPLHIDVSDTGMGIPPDKQAEIFEAFRQADGSIRRRYGGTGLGLNISRRLASLLGGTLKVSSEPGEGATFTLALPLEYYRSKPGSGETEVTQTEADASRVESQEHLPPQADFSGNTVLLVENSVEQMLQLTRILSAWGIEVVAAADEEEIHETLLDNPECLLTLVNTAVCENGDYARIDNIRKESPCRIIVMTDDCGCLSKEQQAHIDGCLRLPVDASELKRVIEESLNP
jgi:signal transduction histidine kinase